MLGSSNVTLDSTMDLPVLSGKQSIRCLFAVPDDILEDGTSLNVVVYLPSSDQEDSTPFTYSIR